MVEVHPFVSDLHAVTAVYKLIDLQLECPRDAGDEVWATNRFPFASIKQDQRSGVLRARVGRQLEAEGEEACRDAIHNG